jgi:hypothetical protein
LEGAHFLTRERGPEVNQLIKHVVMHGRRLQDTRHRYLDINPLPCRSLPLPLEALSCDASEPGSATSYVSPLDFEVVNSPAPSRSSSSTYLLTASGF